MTREEAIQVLQTALTSPFIYGEYADAISMAIKALSEQKTGEWVDDCTCSICHWMHEDNNGFALITKYNYCPNCGAKMGGESDG